MVIVPKVAIFLNLSGSAGLEVNVSITVGASVGWSPAAISRPELLNPPENLCTSPRMRSRGRQWHDVAPENNFYTAVEWMAAKGISVGTTQQSGKPLYKPLDPVSRQAMATFLSRYAHVDVSSIPTLQSFADVPLTSSVAGATKWMKDNGISTGTAQPSGLPLYKPLDPVSRQAMAAFLYRLAHLS